MLTGYVRIVVQFSLNDGRAAFAGRCLDVTPLRRVTVDKERVQTVLDQIRPALQADGGDVALVDITDDGVVQVQLQGACRGCPMSQLTLANGVERVLKEQIPEVVRVEAV
jgi:Fe-S cluster biogenesis protein NfuA